MIEKSDFDVDSLGPKSSRAIVYARPFSLVKIK